MTQPADPNGESSTESLPLDQLDLSPQGLANAPASQEDPDSIVHIEIPY